MTAPKKPIIDPALVDHIDPPVSEASKMFAFLGTAVYSIRWALVPMYLGLWVAMVAYNIQFFGEIIGFLLKSRHDETDYLLWILALIDMTMIGNLVVMITVGGYSTFVREFHLKSSNMPEWLNHLDSNSLKIKIGMSLVGVSAIHLLKTFMDVHDTSWDDVLKEIAIHFTFMGTTIAFTVNAWLSKKVSGH